MSKKNRIIKRYISWILIWFLTVTTVVTGNEITGFAKETSEEYASDKETAAEDNRSSGDMLIEIIEIDDDSDDYIEEDYDSYAAELATDSDACTVEAFSVGEPLTYISNKDFSVYGNTYIRNFLNDKEKAFYDKLYVLCEEYLTTTKNAEVKPYKSDGVEKTNYCLTLKGITFDGLTYDRAVDILGVFSYQNPQFYFLSYRWLKNSTKIFPVCYEAFEDGNTRAAVTEQLFTRVDGWADTVKHEQNEYAMEKKAEDTICANTVYLNDTNQPYEEFADEGWKGYSQTAYSMIMLGKTVCAGYSKAFQMLMNSCGILTVGVTSENHAWNKVRLAGIWYNVDVTWDDGSSGNRITSSEENFNKTDTQFINSGHYQDSIMDRVAPWCDKEFNKNTYDSVYEHPVTSISFDSHEDIVLHLFDSEANNYEANAAVTPENASDKNYHMFTDDESVAYAWFNKIYGMNPGTTYLNVISDDGLFADRRKVIVYGKYGLPDAPVAESVTTTTVTLCIEDDLFNYEFSKDGKNWQRSNVFTGLTPNTQYTFYMRVAAHGYYLASDASEGTVVTTLKDEPQKPDTTEEPKNPTSDAKVTSSSIYVVSTSPSIVAGCVTQKSDSKAELEYRWVACNVNSPNDWFEVSPWKKGSEWLNWKPETFGGYVLVCYTRVVGNEEASTVSASVGVNTNPYIKGICQMPYADGQGPGYLIGIETYDNPNNSYRYEMLILDCTLYAQGKPAWIYSTGKCTVPGNCLWTVWRPKYGYYWTLFRIYDKNNKLIDEECFGFENIY
ncbi:MAG: hypothetical protein IJT72_01270 [Lachnospiraceae bacterium]|nr:hypothetical protein [Lachnospiraceae bacterium]